ncbi:MAG: hypothetical protein WCR72_14405 [Bacteroidota bacterium]
MKNTRFITFLMVFISAGAVKTTTAQSTGFKLSDYKNPDYYYQTLDLNFDMNSSMFINNNNTGSKVTTNHFSLNSGAGANYSLFKNSLKTQTEFGTSFNTGLGTSAYNYHHDASRIESKSNSISHFENLNISGLKRFYNERQRYFEVNGSVYGQNIFNSDHNKLMAYDTTTSKNSTEQRQLDHSITLSLLAGSGRIEQVQDARMALYLLEDLQKINREQRLASDEEVLALAREITLLKYKRFFDTRLRKIAEISAIDSFLQKKGISGTADAAYFTSLNDNWNYANNPVRMSGHRIYLGLETGYSFSYNKKTQNNVDTVYSDGTAREKNASLYLVAGFNCEKPTSLRWQNSSSLKASVGYSQNSINGKSGGFDMVYAYPYSQSFPSVKLAADYGIGYYPNSRTWLTFKWWLLAGWDKEMHGDSKPDKQDFQNSLYAYTGPQFHAYYYLSEKLRLNLTFNGEFRLNHDKFTYTVTEGNPDHQTTKWWNQQVNAGLTYNLF